MNYATIKKHDVANGPGVRVSLFVSGCRRHCPECFNPETWDFCYGQPYTQETEDRIVDLLRPDYIAGLSLLGGEPMEPENQQALLPFLHRMRTERPGKSVWAYTGLTWEQLVDGPSRACTPITRELLGLIDVLVDGPFILEQKDISLRFRGSANQRIIDVPKTLASGEITWWEDEPIFATHEW